MNVLERYTIKANLQRLFKFDTAFKNYGLVLQKIVGQLRERIKN